jgi:acetoacetate decarboxylase
MLPFGVWLTEEPTATMFIAEYPKNSFTVPYHETAMLVHVRTIFGRGVHCLWMLVDDDTALVYGREMLGFPKKMGEFSFVEDNNKVSASVTRRGKTVLKMELALNNIQNDPEPVVGRKVINAAGPGQMFFINPVWLLRPIERISKSVSAEVNLFSEASEFDPLSDIISGEPFNGRVVKSDVLGGVLMLPISLAGFVWQARTHTIRNR